MGGKTDVVKGRIKEAVGALINDDKLRQEGQTDQAIGKVKQAAQAAVSEVKQAAQETVRAAKETAKQAVEEAQDVAQIAVDKAIEAAKPASQA